MATYDELSKKFLEAKLTDTTDDDNEIRRQAANDSSVIAEAQRRDTNKKKSSVVSNTNIIKEPNPYKQQEEYINQLKEQQQRAQLSSLAKARDTSLSNLKSERKQIQPTYYNKRNEASTGSQLQAKNFAEYMAQRGQSSSGVSGQAELARNVALQGNIGQLNNSEANALTDNSRRVTDVNNAYQNDVVGVNAGVEAQSLQNLLSAYQQDLAYQRNQANLDRDFNYNAGINDRNFNYQTGRDAVTDNQFTQQFEYQKQQQTIDNAFRAQQAQIDNLYQQGQLTLAQRSQALNEAQFNYQKQQQNIDNVFREKQFNADNSYRNASLNRSSGGSGSSSSSSSSSYTKTQIKDATLQTFDQLLATDHPETNRWLNENSQELISNLGYNGYKGLVEKYTKAVEEQNLKGYEKRIINSGGR